MCIELADTTAASSTKAILRRRREANLYRGQINCFGARNKSEE